MHARFTLLFSLCMYVMHAMHVMRAGQACLASIHAPLTFISYTLVILSVIVIK